MKRLFSILALCVATLLPAALTVSCEETGKIEVLSTDFTYSVSVADVNEDVPAECVVSITKGGGREEAVALAYKIDGDPSLRITRDGADFPSGSTVVLGAQTGVRLTLPLLSAGQHGIHIELTNQYGLTVSKDVKFFVVHEKVPAKSVAAPAKIRMERGSSLDTAVVISPVDADVLDLSMKVSDEAVVSASLAGSEAAKTLHLQALSDGTATLTFLHDDIRGDAAVTAIEVFSYSIAGLPDQMSMTEGETSTLILTCEPATEISVASTSPCVTVTGAASGTWAVKALEPGSATITVTAGLTRVSCSVSVSKKPETIAVTPMSATIPYGQTKFFSVSSSADFIAEISGPGASVVERTSTGVTVRNENPSFEDARVVLTLTNAADATKKAVSDILIEKKPETISIAETFSESGRAFWTVTGENRGWEIVSAPSGIKAEASGNSIILTNTAYKAVTGLLKVKTTLQGVQAEKTVTVKGLDVELVSLEADPSSFSVEVGSSVSFTLRGKYTDGSSKDVTGEATWTQSQNLSRSGNSFTATATGSAWVRASLGDKTSNIDGEVRAKPVYLTSLVLEPSYFSALVDENRLLSATATFSDGSHKDVTRDCEWSVTGGAQEIGKGYYKMTGVGDVLIEASYSFGETTLSARTLGTVTKPSGTVTGVEIDPREKSLAPGETVTFTGAVRYSDGTRDASGTFSVSPAGILSGADGSYVAAAAGVATVTYSYAGYSASAVVTVSGSGGSGGGPSAGATVQSLILNTRSSTLYVGKTVTVTATALYTDGSAEDVSGKATWSSSNTNVANVAAGVISGAAAGVATVTAIFSGKSADCTVTVQEEVVLSSVGITPASLAFMEGGSGQQLSAKAYFSDGTSRDVTNLGTWSSSNASVASVSAGYVTPGAAGNATVKIRYNGMEGSCAVKVSKVAVVVTSMTMDRQSAALTVGESMQLSATVKYSDGKGGVYNNAYTWSSSDPSVASVSKGSVKALKKGTAVISAYVSEGDPRATCTVVVSDPPATLSSLSLNSTTLTLPVGGTYTLPGDFRVSATMSDGTTQNVTGSVAWSIPSNSYASLSGTTVSALKSSGNSSVAVTASYTYGGVTRTASIALKVTDGGQGTVTGLTASPSSVNLTAGDSPTADSKVTVTASFSDGSHKNVTADCSWEIGAQYASVAYMNGSTIIARNAGTAVLTAKYSSFTADVALVVSNRTIGVTGVSLSRSSLTLTEGATSTLTPTVMPSDATDKSVRWSSNNESVARCANGLVTAYNAGTCVITVTTVDGGKTATCNVTVEPKGVDVTSVKVSPSSKEVEVGSTAQLSVEVSPSNATNKGVTWSSSNTSVAMVNQNGTVTGVRAGTATVYATSDDNGSRYGSCAVTVKDRTVAVTGVEIWKDGSKVTADIEVATGVPVQLTANVLPSDATNKNVTWSSSNSNIVEVSASGLVSAKAAGSATVTVRTEDGGKTATIGITGRQLQYSIVATPASLSWKYDESGSKEVSLALTNISAVAAELTKGQNYYDAPSISGSAGSGYKVSVKPKKANDEASAHQGTVRIKDANDANHYTDVALTHEGKATPYVASLELSPASVSVDDSGDGKTCKLTVKATDQYGDAINEGSLSWETGDKAVATVSGGVITGVGKGSTSVFAKTTNARGETVKSNDVPVTVNHVAVLPSGITINQSSPQTVEMGKTLQLSATVSPDNADDKTVTWSSSAPSVASVDASGLVTAKAQGDAVITAKTVNGKEARCTVHVPVAVSSLKLSPASGTYSSGSDAVTVTVTVEPSGADAKGVSVEADNVFTVNHIKTEGAVHTYSIGLKEGVLQSNSGDYYVNFTSDGNPSATARFTGTLEGKTGIASLAITGNNSYSVISGQDVDVSGTTMKMVTHRNDAYTENLTWYYDYLTLEPVSGGELVTVSKADRKFKVYAKSGVTGTVRLKAVMTIPSGDSPWASGTVTASGEITVTVKEAPRPDRLVVKLGGNALNGSKTSLGKGSFSARFTVDVYDQNNDIMSSPGTVTWSSSNASLVQLGGSDNVSTAGLSASRQSGFMYAYGTSEGTATVTVTCGSVSESFIVEVTGSGTSMYQRYSLDREIVTNTTCRIFEDYETNDGRAIRNDITADAFTRKLKVSDISSGLSVTLEKPGDGAYLQVAVSGGDGLYSFKLTESITKTELVIYVEKRNGRVNIL